MYNAVASDFQVTYAAGLALLYIDVDEGTPATKIAPQMGMESRSLTRILKTLETRGLIYREADPDDRRKVIIRLTPEGVQFRDFSRKLVLNFNEEVRKQIPKERLDDFFKTMIEIQEISEKAHQAHLTNVEAGKVS